MARAPSTQVTVNIANAAMQKLERQLAKRFEEALEKQAATIERLATRAAKDVVLAVARGNGSINFGSKSVGNITSSNNLKNSQLGKYLLSNDGIGALGIPNPESALDTLIDSMSKAVSVSVRIFRGKITIVARLHPNRLLRLNPHPAKRLESGQKIGIDSWLEWTVGPSIDGGTPGFGLARVQTIFRHLTSKTNIRDDRISSIISSSRTLGRAGGQAGIMLPLKARGSGKSPFEALTGQTGQSWKPIPFAQNFWSSWWRENSAELKKGFGLISEAAMQRVAKELSDV